MNHERIVITGIGLTSPLGNDLKTFRSALLAGQSGVSSFPVRNMGDLPSGFVNSRKPSIKSERSPRRHSGGGIGIFAPMKRF